VSTDRRPASKKPSNSEAAASAQRALEGYLPHGGARPARVLCLEEDTRSRKRLSEAGAGLKLTIETARTVEELRHALASAEYDVVMLSLDHDADASFAIARELSGGETPTSILLSARKPTLDQGVLAMRCGAVDLVAKPYDVQELRERFASAAERAQRLRQQARRLERLKRICRRLNQQRQEVNGQVDVLCGDLMNAYQQLADHIETGGNQHQLASIIDAELDVETLLRKTLEYMLTRTGPTNAAVFLPGNSGDFSLGAYVNYNLPKDTADTLLDHLADIVPHRFEDERDLVTFERESQLVDHFGDEAAWLSGSAMITAACHSNDGDCLAVIAIFRDSSEPFTEPLHDEVRVLRDIFARQLAKVVRVHNRAIPKAEWLGFEIGDESDEDDSSSTDWGMAA
jgi:DNA-binding response OmpR family regulator